MNLIEYYEKSKLPWKNTVNGELLIELPISFHSTYRQTIILWICDDATDDDSPYPMLSINIRDLQLDRGLAFKKIIVNPKTIDDYIIKTLEESLLVTTPTRNAVQQIINIARTTEKDEVNLLDRFVEE